MEPYSLCSLTLPSLVQAFLTSTTTVVTAKQHTKLLCRGPPGYLGVWTTTTMPSAVLQAELLTSTCLYEETCHMVNCVALAHYHAHSSLD